MKTYIKNFFSITANTYKYEPMDLFTILTVTNVTLVLLGIHWAPALGILNSICAIVQNVKTKAHINGYVMQIALIILNTYFLTL